MAEFREKIARDFSRHAAQYDSYATVQYHLLEEAVEWLKPHIQYRDDLTLLDVGCGTGMLFSLLHDAGIRGAFHGLDIASNMLAHAKHTDAALTCGDAHMLPYEDACFDILVSNSVLQWAEDLNGICSEIMRILAPSGKAYVTLFGSESLKELRQSFEGLNLSSTLVQLPNKKHVTQIIRAFGGGEVIVTPLIHNYPDMLSMLRSMSRIGAGNKSASPLTPMQLRQLSAYYNEHFNSSEGVFASWEVIQFTLEKAR